MEYKLCCVLVGLPARGKTYIARKIARYMNWLGVRCQVFNVGQYRRQMCGFALPHSFFDPHNETAERQREGAARACLEDMLKWLLAEKENMCAVYDATNSTASRRTMIMEACRQAHVRLIFIESVCGDKEVIEENVKMVKTSSPDYQHLQNRDESVKDFMERIAHYERIYEPVDPECAVPVVRLIDLGRRYEVYGLAREGGLCHKARLTHFLINLQPKLGPIYVCRHGESDFNLAQRIGGDGELSESGWQFANALPNFMRQLGENEDDQRPLHVWTSSFRRTKQTASQFDPQSVIVEEWKALDEIDAGVCEGLTYEEIEARYPRDFAARDRDKFHYRYRGGESYADLVNRLEPIIMELERRRHARILIIGHQAVLRVIIGYFMETCRPDIPYIRVPLHTVVQVRPTAYACDLQEYRVGVAGVDTHRPRPE